MSFEIRPVQDQYLAQVDQLLPSALDGGSNEILVATDDGQVLAAGLIETLPIKTTEARLRIEVAASNDEHRHALVDSLCDIARSWDATSVELVPMLDIDSPEATVRGILGFEPLEQTDTWSLPLPLQLSGLPNENTWEVVVPHSQHTKQVLALFREDSVSSRRHVSTITRILSHPERANLSRILLDADERDPDAPRVTGALVVSRNGASGFPSFASVDDPPGQRARLEALVHSASEAWRDAKLQNLVFVNQFDVEPGLLFEFARENGATMTQQRARWVKFLSG